MKIILSLSIAVLIAGIIAYFIVKNQDLKLIVVVSTLVSILFLVSFYSLKKDTNYQQNLILLGGICVPIAHGNQMYLLSVSNVRLVKIWC